MNPSPHSGDALQAAAAGRSLRAGHRALCLQADEAMAQVIATLCATAPAAANLADAARTLAELAGALALAGEQGLAALAERLRGRVVLAGGPDGFEGTRLSALALRLRTELRHGLERSLRGQPLQAADLLCAWQAMAASDSGGDALDAAPLLSLQADERFELALPAVAAEPARTEPLADAERALLGFLRAASAAERRDAACRLARVLAIVAAACSHSTTRRLWLVLHAYVDELAAGHLDDPARTKPVLAQLLRALRHRADSSLPGVLEPLARQALLALAQAPSRADAGRQVALAFRLEQQWPRTASASAVCAPALVDPADEHFITQLGQWIAAREAGNDGLGPAEDWRALAETARQSVRFAPVAAPLHRLAGALSCLPSDGDGLCVAAAMLYLHAWAHHHTGAEDESFRIADLLERVGSHASAARPGLQVMAHVLERRPLMRSLVAACVEVLEAGERLLDLPAGQLDRVQAASEARRLLLAMAGATRLLAWESVSAQVETVLDPLDTLRTATPEDDGHLQVLAQRWVMLADEVAMLPWTTDWPGDPADELAGTIGEERPATGSVPSPQEAAGGALVDPLVAIFLEEAAGLIDQLRAALLPTDTLAADASPGVALHAAHTLAGCAVTVGLPAMGKLAHALESLLESGLTNPPLSLDPETACQVLDTLDAMLTEFADTGTCRGVDTLLARLDACMPPVVAMHTPWQDPAMLAPDSGEPPIDAAHVLAHAPDADVLPAGLSVHEADAVEGSPALRAGMAADDDTFAPAVPEDAELLAIFREEAADLLPRLEQALHEWNQSPDDRAAPPLLLRILHTLKGSARMAGQLAWGEALHRCEAEVGMIAQLAPAAIRERLAALQAEIDDWRRAWCGSSGYLPAEASSHDCAGTDDPADLAAQPATVAATAAAVQPEPAPAGPPVPAQASSAPSPASSSSLLRVHTEKFTAFADAVAELWVGHARLTDGMQQQRRAMTELADNLARLRAQVRELEIDAESRIVSGAASADHEGFDPLEFDRYTRLHEITRMIAESTADLVDLQRHLMRQGDGLSRTTDAQARDLRSLQSSLQAVRSQPFGTIEARLRQVLRQAARESGREVDCVITGASVEVDRSLLDRLAGPLEHVLRNAVVHGIELPAERAALGKPRTGRITLSLLSSAAELRLELADDGRGLDLERIRDRASAVGLLVAQANQDAQVLSDLIFQPGFSTASEVTALAGRGIGLDAVRSELQALGGRISVDSRTGAGCRFTMVVPLTLATLPVLLVRAGRHRIGLLAHRLQQLLQLKPGEPGHDAGSRTLRWQGSDIPLADLAHLLGEPPQPVAGGARIPVAVLRESDRLLALRLDAVDGQRELVVKNPGQQLARVPGIAGASLLGDGGIALVVDPFRLGSRDGQRDPAPAEPESGPLVLVVDDSLTVRRASQRLLERHGYEVALARDGVEALASLRERRPRVVLLDIEMPRMDGFELLAVLRDDPQLRELPVVMITSRIADRHRQRALQLGASAYLGKPFREEELVSLLSGLCRSTSGERDEGRMENQSRSHGSEAAA